MAASLAALSLAACIAISPDSDHILGRDLAAVFPALAVAAPQAQVALAPMPGVPRVFHAGDMRILAARFHLEGSGPVEPFCVELPVAPLDPARLLRAMQHSFPGARIEMVEFSRQPAPAGAIAFSPADLHSAGSNGMGLWNGFVRYAATRKFAIWARVKVFLPVTRVRANRDLLPGKPIEAARLTVETREEFPSDGPFAERLADVAGRWPRVPVRAGSAVRLDQLAVPKDVMRGEKVRVEVRNRNTRLFFDGIAQASGCIGESVLVLNGDSHKVFRARVEDKGRVAVDANPPGTGEIH